MANTPEFGMGETHTWFAFFDSLAPRLDSFLATLSDEERERARRFRFPKDRDAYVLAQGFLREILSQYVGIAACELRFELGAHGKPFLVEAQSKAHLRFNLSHAQGAVICALAHDCEVGVDLEPLREHADALELSKNYFSEREAIALAGLPASERGRAFLTCWTRKEAYIKARGEGLRMDLKSFEVFGPDEAQPQLRVCGNPEESHRWTVRDLDVPEGYVAALVLEGKNCNVKSVVWSGKMEGLNPQ